MKIDKRFYGESNSFKLSDLSKIIKSTFPDLFHSCNFLKDQTINSCSAIESASNKDIVFLENKKYFKYLNNNNAVCLIIAPEALSLMTNKNFYIATKQPRRVFAHILNLISPGNLNNQNQSEISSLRHVRNLLRNYLERNLPNKNNSEQKEKYSHRGRAFEKLIPELKTIFNF